MRVASSTASMALREPSRSRQLAGVRLGQRRRLQVGELRGCRASATSSIASRVRRLNVAPSPVPCTSMSVPVSVATTFVSTSARESSS